MDSHDCVRQLTEALIIRSPNQALWERKNGSEPKHSCNDLFGLPVATPRLKHSDRKAALKQPPSTDNVSHTASVHTSRSIARNLRFYFLYKRKRSALRAASTSSYSRFTTRRRSVSSC